MFHGQNVLLRPFEKSDLESCKKLVNDPETAKNLLRILPVSMYEHEKWYEKIITDQRRVTFALETVKENRYIGSIGLMNIDWRNRKGELWIYIDKDCWGQGFGKEASSLFLDYIFKSLNLHRVYLKVGGFNSRALSLYRSLGFVEEGKLREDVYFEGRYYDVFRMAVLRQDWENV